MFYFNRLDGIFPHRVSSGYSPTNGLSASGQPFQDVRNLSLRNLLIADWALSILDDPCGFSKGDHRIS
jgi:hypothetical protein